MTIWYKKLHVYTRHLIAIFRNVKKSLLKWLPRESILCLFRYRYALLQKIKNVLTYYEHIFDFLKKCVPITEIAENCVTVSGFSLKNAWFSYNLDLDTFKKTSDFRQFSSYFGRVITGFNPGVAPQMVGLGWLKASSRSNCLTHPICTFLTGLKATPVIFKKTSDFRQFSCYFGRV